MSLADELLADLEEAGLEGEEATVEEQDEDGIGGIDEIEDIDAMDTGQGGIDPEGIRNVARLISTEQFTRVMNGIDEYEMKNINKQMVGMVEADPEYKLIVESNNLTMEIDNEINIIHKFCRDHYSKRFPELDSLVPTPLEYIRTIKELGNDLEKYKNNEALQQVISNATIMVVSVTASTTQGKVLSEEELMRIFEACDMTEQLLKAKVRILTYVESRMSYIAPNLTVIIGATVAAKLMGVAGGLTALTKMPACNIMLLGSQKRTLSGFSSTAINPHTGFIYYSDAVQMMPADLRRKASRLLAAKLTLAARVDSFHESPDGTVGMQLKEEITAKFEKWQEPPPVKQVKALPAPVDPGRKKRGGRRYRKMKERLGMTEMHKQANRMNFGEIEEDAYQDSIGFSLGQLGKSGSGRIRAAQVDNKTQVRISKTLQTKLQRANRAAGASTASTWGGKTTVRDRGSGTASSVAFTPLKGIEIVNPNAAEQKAEEEDGCSTYFSNMSSFVKLAPRNVATN
uniref:U4/U6 small nuclear ribonucleoprotein Prp31 n=1 Tax=Phallusia mammillata TaxID=59560 RepID=A0A6F9DQC4_9ASCI|nr:U4/U6 small nuclear ribonucleoprotein Prp31 [Phallusia mammillata]